MTQTLSVTRDIASSRSSPGLVAETGGGKFRLFSSSRFTMSNAVQGKLVNVGAVCMSSPSRHGHCDREGFADVQKVSA